MSPTKRVRVVSKRKTRQLAELIGLRAAYKVTRKSYIRTLLSLCREYGIKVNATQIKRTA